jgi:hypothetical protein
MNCDADANVLVRTMLTYFSDTLIHPAEKLFWHFDTIYEASQFILSCIFNKWNLILAQFPTQYRKEIHDQTFWEKNVNIFWYLKFQE